MCSSFEDFTESEKQLINKSINAFNYNYREGSEIEFCEYDKKIGMIDQKNQSYFCYKDSFCPYSGSFTNADFDYKCNKQCGSISIFSFILIIFVIILI